MKLFTQATWIAAAILVVVARAAAPVAAETWHGVVSAPAGAITVVVELDRGADGRYHGTLVDVDQAPAEQLALADVVVTADALTFAIPSLGATYEARWNAARAVWSGVFRQGMAVPLLLARGAPPTEARIDGLDGTWRGSLRRGDTTLRLVLHVQTGPRGTVVTLDSPDLGALGLAVRGLAHDGDAVRFAVPVAQVTFAGRLDAEQRAVRGTWTRVGQPDAEVAFARDAEAAAARTQGPVAGDQPARPFNAAAARGQGPVVSDPTAPPAARVQAPEGYRAVDVAFDNPRAPGVTLAGTLTIPDGPGPFPAAVLISGAGPQDRDETLSGHKPFAVLADYLSRHGIAVLRYDDRGFARSTGDHGSATSADFATDALAAVRFLRGRAEIDRAAIGLVGHSEGGVIGPLAALEDRGLAFLVLLAGPGTTTEQLLLSQRRMLGKAQGLGDALIDRGEPIVRRMLRAARTAPDTPRAEAAIRALLTDATLRALGAAPAERDALALAYAGAWMRTFLRYDPRAVLSRLRLPVLALGGTLDHQVPSGDNLPALRRALVANPDATVRELPGLNHMFQTARTGTLDEYAGIAETFAPVALDAITRWIRARFAPRAAPAGR